MLPFYLIFFPVFLQKTERPHSRGLFTSSLIVMVMAHEGASETPGKVRPWVRHCFKASLEDDPCQTKYLKTVWDNEIHFKLH